MDKKLLTGLGLGAVALATASTTQVEAAQVTTAPSPTTQTSITTASSQPTQTVPTQSDVVAAQTNLTDVNNQVATQQGVVDSAQQAVTTAQQNVTTAQTNVDSAQQAVTTAQQNVTSAQQAVTTQQANVTSAQQAVTTQQGVVDSAQQAVTTAQAALDGTGASTIIATRDQAQANVTSSQQAVTTAQTNLSNAVSSDAARTTAINNATTLVNTANTNLSSAQTELNTAQTVANQTTTTLNTANTALTSAQNEANAINTLVTTQEYVDAMKAYASSMPGTTQYNDAIAKLKQINASVRALNTYKSNPNDKAVVLTDLNNLDTATRQDLSLFMADLINQIRKEFGTTLATVTPSSLTLSDNVTDIYVSDNWDWNKVNTIGHDTNALNNAGTSLGVVGTGEDLNSWKTQYSSLSLDDLKRLAYESLLDFLYNGQEWLHAESITGIGVTDNAWYMGADLSERGDVVSIHVNFTTPSDFGPNSTFNTTALANPYDSTAILNALAQAQTAYNKANSDNQAAQQLLAQATNTYNNALANLNTAKDNLVKAQALPILTPDAQKALDQAKAKLASDQQALATAQQAVDMLNADIKVKQANLDQAKSNLAIQQAKLADLNGITQAQLEQLKVVTNAYDGTVVALKTAEGNLTTAKASLLNAQNYLANIKNAPVLLAQAKSELAKAQTELATAQKYYNEQKAILDALLAKQADAQSQYDIVNKAYQDYLAKLAEENRLAKIAKDLEAIQNMGGVPVPILNENGVVVGYVDGKNKATNNTVVPVSFNVTSKVSHGEKLPTTNEKANLLGALGLLISSSSLLALGLRKKHQ
ncbi:SEC10/PgrA surface exclusion domain-containing protein [Streptococcus uberis]|uniref:SEC10/PgrA surface exclusion domain-containing protein n=1 Tax=Streptococcus uberis TaxID=1349 RepID=UPI0027DC80CC|nr:SEC10/PgrA surface exclusion domain-containing protein [Streptococcus uberis]MCK1236956.1 SEC10/PgrA surface exclusion domain-containing protein [Streptococcus uberis]